MFLQFDWTLSWQAMKVGEAAKKKARVTRLYLEDHPTDGSDG
jgi:hypothetical protein